MADYIKSGATNPCPICSRTKDSDCRWNEEVVMCHSNLGGNATVQGWKYQSDTPDGLWGTYFPEKEVRPKSRREFVYYLAKKDWSVLEPVIRSVRVDDGFGKKTIWQESWDGESWVKKITTLSKAKMQPYYKLHEAMEISDEPILFVEGEPIVDALLKIGIPATTSIGGCGAWGKYGCTNLGIQILRERSVILCPDRDQPGVEYMEKVASSLYPNVKGWIYAKPDSLIWDRLPKNGGEDLLDWINCGATSEQILAAIEPKREPVAEVKAATNEGKSGKLTSDYESTPAGGLIYSKITYDKKGQPKSETTWVGDHITATAWVNSPEKDAASLYLEFLGKEGAGTVTIRRADITVDGNEVIRLLQAHGYFYDHGHRKLLLRYINGLGKSCKTEYTVTRKTGWTGNTFVLPDRSFGDETIRFEKVDRPTYPIFAESGTLAQWKKNVAAKTIGNSRLTFALGIAFSSPLNTILGVEAGGYHLYATTSTGKTSSLWVSASVYGKAEQHILPWRVTSNALEYKAAARNHLALFLDEIGQATAFDVAQSAYMLANGRGKSRLRRDLTEQDTQQWNLTFLSSGEHTLASYLELGKLETKGGQENRMPSIPACPEGGYGVFEDCHGQDPAEFSISLKSATQKYCGTAFTQYMQVLCELRCENYDNFLRSRHTEIRAALVNGHPRDEVIERVAHRIACVQLGLELAKGAKTIDHTSAQIEWAIKKVFDDWVCDRGGAISFDLSRQLKKITHLFTAEEFGRRILRLDATDTQVGQVVDNLLTYRSGDHFWIPPSVFEKEICGEVNEKTMKAALIDKGWLIPSADRNTQLKRVNGKRVRVYVFTRFWGGEEEEQVAEKSTSAPD
jgi:putative DNA primase/helicase